MESAKIQKFKCDVLSNFQTMCMYAKFRSHPNVFVLIFTSFSRFLKAMKARRISRQNVQGQFCWQTTHRNQIAFYREKKGASFRDVMSVFVLRFTLCQKTNFCPQNWDSIKKISGMLEHGFHEKKSQSQNSIQHFEFSRTFFSTGSRTIAAQHGVWKSQKKSHSTLRAKRASYTFWVDKS